MPEPWFPASFDAVANHVAAGRHVDAVITALADRQHGTVTARQLHALGVTKDHIIGRLRRGHLHRISPGVYLVGRLHQDAVSRRMGAVLAAGRGAVLADLSAAAQLGAAVRAPGEVHVIVPPGRLVKRRGVSARSAVVHPHERATPDGIPCLTMARVLLDVAAHRPRRVLEDLWHDAIYRKLLSDTAVHRVLQDHHGEPGTVELRRLVERRERAIGDVANRLEAEMRDIIEEAGMPEPRANQPMEIDGVRLKPDLYIPERGLAFETDGRDGHADPEQQAADARKDRLYRSRGLTVCRHGWWAVHYERSRVLRDLVRFEAAWQRCGGNWTLDAPPPAFTRARRPAG